MSQTVTSTQLENLSQSVNAGGVAAAAAAYSTLYAQGYNYAGWAQGVATGDSTSGNAALSFLQGTALMGMGGEQCLNLTPAQIDKIRVDMASATLKMYKAIADKEGGLHRDLRYDEVKAIHEAVFTDNHLSLDNWTLNTPMELIRAQYGDQAVENIWRQMRDTGGDGADALHFNGLLLLFMNGALNSQNPDVRQKADAWLDQFGLSELIDITRNTWPEIFGPIEDLFNNIQNLFNRAKIWTWPRDPLILDLDGDGLETVGLSGSTAYFDFDGDGVLSKSGWVGRDDALLVWDKNNNGAIDTGAELFGDFTPLANGSLAPNGFAALAGLDANGDGVIDAADPAFAELKLWRDASQDGQTGSGELISLSEAGIVSLNLANLLKNQTLANGNTLAREGSFTRADGSTSAMGEFRLAIDTFDSQFAQAIEVPVAQSGHLCMNEYFWRAAA